MNNFKQLTAVVSSQDSTIVRCSYILIKKKQEFCIQNEMTIKFKKIAEKLGQVKLDEFRESYIIVNSRRVKTAV